jgi:hypothetical protein
VGIAEVRSHYARAVEAFKSTGAQNALQIQVTEPKDEFDATYRGLK